MPSGCSIRAERTRVNMIHMQCMDEKVTAKLANDTVQFKDTFLQLEQSKEGMIGKVVVTLQSLGRSFLHKFLGSTVQRLY